MKTVRLPDGKTVPAFGLGTWQTAENPQKRADEIAALRYGIEQGAALIDTAEMYADGGAEELVAEAVQGRRDSVFIVSKVYPHNGTIQGTAEACARSLKRLKTDRIDLYLLHWRGSVPLEETLEGFKRLKKEGKIRHYGVSNFDTDDMKEWWGLDGGKETITNQVLYNLDKRGVEWDLLPWQRERKISTMAYSPLGQARLFRNKKFLDFAERHSVTPAQAALAWLLRHDDVIVIPKSGSVERVKENLGALKALLTPVQLKELDVIFPAPKTKQPLAMI